MNEPESSHVLAEPNLAPSLQSHSDQSLEFNVSRPVYLHFLDRELMSNFSVYESGYSCLDDLRLVLFATYEPAYLSASLVFENRFARQVIDELTPLFRNGHIEVMLSANGLYDFTLLKKDQYSHAATQYPFYFDSTWKHISDLGPSLRHRTIDSNAYLIDNIARDIYHGGAVSSSKRMGFEIPEEEITVLAPRITDTLQSAGKKAITRLLFTDAYHSRSPRPEVRRSFDVKINEWYTRLYLSERGGTIATGLSCGVEHFSFLCQTFPYHHIPLWREIYGAMSYLRFIREVGPDNIVKLREEPAFRDFVHEVRRFINFAVRSGSDGPITGEGSTQRVVPDLERLFRTLLSGHRRQPANIDGFLRTLEEKSQLIAASNTSSLVLEVAQPRKAVVMSEENVVFVAYGRNEKIRVAMFEFLRSVGIKPYEWDKLVEMTGEGSPFVGNVVERGLQQAKAIVVLFTGDDLAQLRPELLRDGESEERPTPQPRPNVIFEAGLAFAINPQRTIVVQIGRMRQISDILGRHIVYMDNSPDSRNRLLGRLRTAGCYVDQSSSDWIHAGAFPDE